MGWCWRQRWYRVLFRWRRTSGYGAWNAYMSADRSVAGVYKRKKRGTPNYQIFAAAAVFLTALSFYLFPWDVVQRLDDWALRFVSMLETSAIFFRLAQACLCVPAASAMDRVGKEENKLIALGVPRTVILACLGVCIYQCSILGRFLYQQQPLV